MGETGYSKTDGHPSLREAEDGTKIRYKYTRGEYAGEVAEAEINGGHIVYNGEKYSPTGATRAALCDIRGSAYERNGWEWWEYYDKEEEQWKPLEKLK